MNSASIAKTRLLTESIEQKKLAELKEVATELALSTAEVKNYGSLTLKSSWIQAINNKVAQIFEGGENSYHHQDSLAPEEELEGSVISSNSLTEESMIAPPEDSENFVESPVPPSSVPVELPEEPEDQEESSCLFSIPCINIFPDNFKELPQSGVTEERFDQIIKEAEEIASQYLKNHPWQPGEFEAMYPGVVANQIPFDGEEDDWASCPKCDGFGYIGSNHDEICHHCFGEGLVPPKHTTDPLILGKSSRQIALEINEGFDGCHTVGEPCETCNGTGLVPDFNGDGDEICPDCGGTGYAENPEPIIESIPEDLQASDFEKETIVEFFKAEGMPEQDIEELRSKPLSKLEASACLGFVEHYKKSAEIALRCYLVDWVNDLAGDADRCFSRAEQMNILFSWKFISEVKVKLAHHFQLKPGEINCFLTPDGYRVSVPSWTKEQILTPQETEFITANDPVVAMFGNGYLFALEHFKEQVALHLIEVSS